MLYLEFLSGRPYSVMSDREGGRPWAPTSHIGEGGSTGTGDSATRSWEKFSHWVCCVCVVTFDLELGQAIEVSWQDPNSHVWQVKV